MSEFDIKELRKRIDLIDNEFRDLLKTRLEIVSLISKYKKENNLPILDSSREEEILNNISEKYKNDYLKDYYIDLQKELMTISKNYQSK